LDRTQIITIYKGPLHIINNYKADAFAKDYLDRIIKKTEKSLNNTCILYTGRKTKSGYTVIDVRLPGHSRFVPMNVHRLGYMIHTRTE
jgi:hypothetical protein